jgi:hypothetical protein
MSMQRPNAGLRRVGSGPTPNAGYRAALDQQVSANVMELQPGTADATARADLLARLQARPNPSPNPNPSPQPQPQPQTQPQPQP